MGARRSSTSTWPPGESTAAWEAFLTDLFQRGLLGSQLQRIRTDGSRGLRAAVSWIYPLVPLQLCWAHRSRNILAQVRKKDQEAVKRDLQIISHADHIVQARSWAQHLGERWGKIYPKVVACLQRGPEELSRFFL